MKTEIDSTQMSLKWLEIWRIAFLRPTIRTFSRIISDPKASTKWGVVWAAIATFIFWFVSPLTTYLWGIVASLVGLQAASYFWVIGALVSSIFGVSTLLINAAIAHSLARLFNGVGTFHQLVYAWGAMQLPFILVSGLAFRFLPFVYHISLLLLSRQYTLSTLGIISLISLFMATVVILYLLYAEVVAFSAVEKFGIGKGLGILLLLVVLIGIASTFSSFGFQALVMKFLRY